ADLRKGAHGVDRGSAVAPEGARGQDPAPLLRARRRGADDAGADRRAPRNHARAGSADQGKGAVEVAARLARARARVVPRLARTASSQLGRQILRGALGGIRAARIRYNVYESPESPESNLGDP